MNVSNETAAPPLGEGLTFEKVWAALMELRESQREAQKASQEEMRKSREESQREMRKSREESQREMTEAFEKLRKLQEETARQMKETDKRVGEVTNRFGDMVEHMVVPNLVAKFQELGFTFTRVAPNVRIVDREHDIITEIDAFLENGDKVMIVETKIKPDIGDIQDHLERMKKLRVYADLHEDTRKYLGAIAGVVVDESVKNYALKKGLYVLEPSGETFAITEPGSQGYIPHEW